MLRLLVVLLFAACSSTKPVSKQDRLFAAPADDVKPPRCLNVQDGDRHVEFDGTSLWLAEEGAPKQLKLADAPVECELFEVIKNARKPSVVIEYKTSDGARVAIATIADAKWLMKPTDKTTITWTTDPGGRPLITSGNKQYKP